MREEKRYRGGLWSIAGDVFQPAQHIGVLAVRGDHREASLAQPRKDIAALIGLGARNRIKAANACPLSEGIEVLQERGAGYSFEGVVVE